MASLSTRQLLLALTDAFNALKAQLLQNGSGSTTPIDAYTKAQADTLLAGKASKQDITNLVGAAPAALDTLAEIDAQLKADEVGTAAILATQQQHTQQLTGLIRVPAYTAANYGMVLGLTASGVLTWVAAPASSGETPPTAPSSSESYADNYADNYTS